MTESVEPAPPVVIDLGMAAAGNRVQAKVYSCKLTGMVGNLECLMLDKQTLLVLRQCLSKTTVNEIAFS
ncbi:hypothetical protein [Methylomarinum vadi]|uniref:hypothetical protein n=1 Tax=Methylomarinum vadi TaxID=438855 RepID=UPI001F458F21|nr:hypothetical protein [Methylomarinum vadi]